MSDDLVNWHYDKFKEGPEDFDDLHDKAVAEIDRLKQQLQQARREGWEQGKKEAFEIARTTQIGYIQTTIAAMEYKEKEELKNWCDIEGVAP